MTLFFCNIQVLSFSQSININSFSDNPVEVHPLVGGNLTINYEYTTEVGSIGNSIYIGLEILDENNEYQRTRAVAYPKIGDQLDSLYHDILNNKLDKTGTWFTGITDVKNTTTLDEILLDGTDGSSTNAGDKVLLG